MWRSPTTWLAGDEGGLSATLQFPRLQQVPERNLKSDLLSVPVRGRPGYAAGRDQVTASLTLIPRTVVKISEWLTMPIPSPWYDNPYFVPGLVCSSVDTLFLLSNKSGFLFPLSFSQGRKCAVYSGRACQGTILAPTMVVKEVRTSKYSVGPISPQFRPQNSL